MGPCYLRGISMSLSHVMCVTTVGETQRATIILRLAVRGNARGEGHRALGALSRVNAAMVSLALRMHPWCILWPPP